MAALNLSQPHFRPQRNHVPSLPQAPQQQQQQGEPLAAPQPTRTHISPPQVPTPGMWTPEMGIRFGGPPSPAKPSPGQGVGRDQGFVSGKWEPNREIRFS